MARGREKGDFRGEKGLPHSGVGRVRIVSAERDGSKLWAPAGGKVAAERSGSRIRVTVYGAVAGDSTRLMRTYDAFNGANFVMYLEPARRVGQGHADHG